MLNHVILMLNKHGIIPFDIIVIILLEVVFCDFDFLRICIDMCHTLCDLPRVTYQTICVTLCEPYLVR